MSTLNNLLSNIYFDVENPGSFGGIQKLYKSAKKINPLITLNKVKDWATNQLTYTLHKQIRRNYLRNRIIVQRKNEQFEADLVDMQNFSRYNNGYKYILTVIDCFSKYLYAFSLKNKVPSDIIKALTIIFKENKPVKLRTDRGLEFNNSKVQKFLKDNEVIYFTSNDTKIKCAIVERVNRTLKSKMFRYFTSKGTRKYIDVLQNIVDSYNKSYHRSIKMRPIDVSDDNREEVFENIYKVKKYKEFFDKNTKTPKLNLKDTVRLKYDLNKDMDKSFYPLWSDRTYKVDEILKKPKKPNYRVISEGTKLKRSYYPEEVQKIGSDPIYRIEKIIRKRKVNGEDQVLVKYIGYPNQFNQWILKSNLINLKAGSTTARRPHQKN